MRKREYCEPHMLLEREERCSSLFSSSGLSTVFFPMLQCACEVQERDLRQAKRGRCISFARDVTIIGEVGALQGRLKMHSAGARLHADRSLLLMTKRMALVVVETEQILLSTTPASFPAVMRSRWST